MVLIEFIKSRRQLSPICQLIKKGEIVALPTETAYGLAADGTNAKAVAKIVGLKGRQPNKPIALLAADLKMVRRFFIITPTELRLVKKFWPGPLTLLLKPKYKFFKNIIGPGRLVGVRVPGDKWLRELISVYGNPLTATSANLSGQPASYSASAVKKSLVKRGLKYLVKGGRLPRQATSTVVKVKNNKVEVIRPGAISRRQIKDMVS